MLQRVTRTRTEQAELETLSPQAAHASESLGRLRPEEPDEYRTCFQRDRDRILHSKSFRRLMHKTQVFLSPEGDHYRTRLTHTLEVSQIARTIARALSLNEDLTEAIALGHDLGHTPFGHTGEDALSLGIARRMGREGQYAAGERLFRHNEQSVRVVEYLERDGGASTSPGGGGRHPLPHGPGARADPGGRIVATADRIAYVNHDIDDAIRAGILTEADLPSSTHRVLGATPSAQDRHDGARHDRDLGRRGRRPHVRPHLGRHDGAALVSVPQRLLALRRQGRGAQGKRLVIALFDYYVDHPDEVPDEYRT